MPVFSNTNELIQFAISVEKQMIDVYDKFASLPDCKKVSEVFRRFSYEEKIHLGRLEDILSSGQLKLTSEQLAELSNSDYEVRQDCCASSFCPKVLKEIMEIEKMAFRLYFHIATLCSDKLLKLVFETLATDQSRHKLFFEIELDKI